MGDRTGFAQGNHRFFNRVPVSTFDWVEVLSTLAGALFIAVATAWVLLTCVIAYKLTPCPGILPLPRVKLQLRAP